MAFKGLVWDFMVLVVFLFFDLEIVIQVIQGVIHFVLINQVNLSVVQGVVVFMVTNFTKRGSGYESVH